MNANKRVEKVICRCIRRILTAACKSKWRERNRYRFIIENQACEFWKARSIRRVDNRCRIVGAAVILRAPAKGPRRTTLRGPPPPSRLFYMSKYERGNIINAPWLRWGSEIKSALTHVKREKEKVGWAWRTRNGAGVPFFRERRFVGRFIKKSFLLFSPTECQPPYITHHFFIQIRQNNARPR